MSEGIEMKLLFPNGSFGLNSPLVVLLALTPFMMRFD
jgi:hypothetical protein